MFINLIRLLCAYGNTKTYILGRELGYKTPSAFQSVISKNDLRLGVLQAICGALGFSIVILDEQGRTVANVSDYIQRQTEQPPEH